MNALISFPFPYNEKIILCNSCIIIKARFRACKIKVWEKRGIWDPCPDWLIPNNGILWMTRLDGGKLPIWWQICDRHKIFCARDASEGRESKAGISHHHLNARASGIHIQASNPTNCQSLWWPAHLFFFIRLPLQSGHGVSWLVATYPKKINPPFRSMDHRYH